MRVFLSRIKACRRRYAKNALEEWLPRWDRASRRSWAILTNGPASVERFHRFERNHNRLLRLSEARRNFMDSKRGLVLIAIRATPNLFPFLRKSS